MRRGQTGGSDVGPLATAIRWGTLSLAVLSSLSVHAPRRDVALAAALVVYAMLRTVQPLAPGSGRSALAALAFEAVIGLAVVTLSGGWSSPFLLVLGSTLVIAGLQGGALAVGVVTTVLLAGAALLAAGGARIAAGDAALERLGSLAVVGAVGAYARWVLRSGDEERLEEVRRLRSAHQVNSLLLELYARVAGGPVTLSLDGALASTVERLRAVLDPDVVLLLLADGADGSDGAGGPWQVMVSEGLDLPRGPALESLPPVLAAAAAQQDPILWPHLELTDGVGAVSSTGVYASLWAESGRVGVLAIERGPGRRPFSPADVDVAAEVARHAGLAIDNARWFGRLRTLGAAAERGRIARELHDRVGQSLAAAGFGMDALAARVGADPAAPAGLAAEMRELAAELHSATRGVREELADLRADTSPGVDLEGTLEDLLIRVRSRSGLGTELVCDAADRPPPVVEREIWRIAQEAVLNAERHAGATHIAVRWRRDAGESLLEVVDNGRGIDASVPTRADAYGLVGMRERADAIGASLMVTAPPGQGTTVRLRLAEV